MEKTTYSIVNYVNGYPEGEETFNDGLEAFKRFDEVKKEAYYRFTQTLIENYVECWEEDYSFHIFAGDCKLESFTYDCNSFLQDCLAFYRTVHP